MSDDEPLEIYPGFHGWAFYILDDDHQLVEVPDLIEWATWSFGDNQDRRFVALDAVGDISVSTIFLGCISKGMIELFAECGMPMRLFETLITDRGVVRKYATWAEAVAGHELIVNELREELKNERNVGEC